VGAGENFTVTKDNVSDLMEKLQKTIRQMPDFDKLKNQIEMTITAEGLRVEMMETETGTFFDVGSPRPNGTRGN
jgi:chemotaxis protein MotB